MAKIHFRPYNSNQTVLFPQRIDAVAAIHCLKGSALWDGMD